MTSVRKIVPEGQNQKFSGYQKFVVAILAFLQFTLILDFMIMSPLGAVIIPTLKITTTQFGLAVSAYAFSAGASGLLAAGFADKYDRKKLLLFFYTGFVVATLLCGIAPTYPFLIMARVLTGLFGGVIGSIVLAITTDLFPPETRGRVMGLIQTAFAASQILGLPLGLFFSNLWGWHAPFLFIVAIGLGAAFLIATRLQPIDAHLKLRVDRNVFHHFWHTLSTGKYLFAFLSTALLSIGGFMLMPFGSAFTVNNLGISIEKLPLVYLVTGVAAMFIGPLVGRASDRFGNFSIFVFGSVMSVVMVLIYTNMGVTPLPWVIAVNALMFVGIFSRMIPSQSLMTSIPEPTNRGAFMSISSSMQQIAGGCASALAGVIVTQRADGYIEHFNVLGYVLIGTALITVIMIYFINRMVIKSATK
jgi:predicted MFS family arabinose efflux permease